MYCNAPFYSLVLKPNCTTICCNKPIIKNNIKELFEEEQFFNAIIKNDKELLPDVCKTCGLRFSYNFSNTKKALFSYIKNGEHNDFNYLDIVLGNNCNLNCVMCTPSSCKHKNNGEELILNDEVLNSIEFDKIENISICGGETFLYLEKLDNVLSMCSDKNKINIFTNCTIYNKNIEDLFLKYNHLNITLTISIDSYGIKNDNIRIGSNYNNIVNVLNKFKDLRNNNFVIKINTTFSKYNILDINNILIEFNSILDGDIMLYANIVNEKENSINDNINEKDIINIINNIDNIIYNKYNYMLNIDSFLYLKKYLLKE